MTTKAYQVECEWYDWVAVCVIVLLWIEHYMDWKLRIVKEMEK